MKKIACAFLSIIVMLPFLVTNSLADTKKSGDLGVLRWSFSGNKLVISAKDGFEDNGNWQMTQSSEPVYSFWGYYYDYSLPWREFSDQVYELVLASGVKVIPSNAFYDLTKLKSVKMASTVEKIGSEAFIGCKSISELVLSKNLTSIESSAFSQCAKITSVELPDSVTNIGFNAFSECTSLKTVVLPKYLEEISSSAFSGCKKLKSVTFPQNLKRIGYSAFQGCSSLSRIELPAGLETIESYAFADTALEYVVMPDKVNGEYNYSSSIFDSEVVLLKTAVSEYESNENTSVIIPEQYFELKKGEKCKPEAEFKGHSLTWESENPKVAKVSASGTITAVSAGYAQIKVSYNNRYYAKIKVFVVIPATSVKFKSSARYLSVNEIYAPELVITPENANQEIIYEISETDSAQLYDDTIRGVREGDFTLTVKMGDIKARIKVTVEDPKLNITSKEMTEGYANKLKLSNTKRKIKWTSANPSVVSVSSDGSIVAKKRGYACIIAQVGNMKYYCDINVYSKLQNKILALQEKYPDGRYWNNNPPSKEYPAVSDIPCTDHHSKTYALCKGQCAGYANLISNEVFGAGAPYYTLNDKSKIKVGDYIRDGNHSIFVINVVHKGDMTGYDRYNDQPIYSSDGYVEITDCNYYYDCGIHWFTRMSLNSLSVDATSYSRYI